MFTGRTVSSHKGLVLQVKMKYAKDWRRTAAASYLLSTAVNLYRTYLTDVAAAWLCANVYEENSAYVFMA
jgi:hypothetical protein